MLQKYRNKKIVERKYKNGVDLKWYIPSTKKLMIEYEFIFDQKIEKLKIEAVNNKRDVSEEIFRNLKNVVRDSLVASLVATGKGTEK